MERGDGTGSVGVVDGAYWVVVELNQSLSLQYHIREMGRVVIDCVLNGDSVMRLMAPSDAFVRACCCHLTLKDRPGNAGEVLKALAELTMQMQ